MTRVIGCPAKVKVGDRWLTFAQMSKLCGKSAQCLRYRVLVGGLKPAMAMKLPLPERREQSEKKRSILTLNGDPIKQKDLARLAGVSECMMSKRLHQMGMTPEQAVVAPIIGHRRKSKQGV
jgi:hypothetical protein